MEAVAVAAGSSRETAESQFAPRRRQVTLRGLFLCTTYFAVSSALATKFGLGIFVLMNGVFLTWLSFRGYLWWLQTNRARPMTYGMAWLLFAVSFGLPAFTVKGCGSGPPQTHYGWQAAMMTAGTVQETLDETKSLLSDPTQRTAKRVWELFAEQLLIVLWNLPNLLMLASPFLLYRQQRGKGRVLSVLFSCAAVSSWTWGVTVGPDLRIGYYVWSSGITVIAIARPQGWRSLAAMGALGAFWLILALFS